MSTITYQDALTTLGTMFPEFEDVELLTEILRMNNGHMERSIEVLLMLQSELFERGGEDDAASHVPPPPASSVRQSQSQPRSSPAPVSLLPDDFLSLPGDSHRSALQSQPSHMNDEDYARQLQMQFDAEMREAQASVQRIHLAASRPDLGRSGGGAIPSPASARPAPRPASPSVFDKFSAAAKLRFKEIKQAFGNSKTKPSVSSRSQYSSLPVANAETGLALEDEVDQQIVAFENASVPSSSSSHSRGSHRLLDENDDEYLADKSAIPLGPMRSSGSSRLEFDHESLPLASKKTQ